MEQEGRAKDIAEIESSPTLDSLYRDYGGRILNLAYQMTFEEETARDLTHDVFLKVYESLDRFNNDSHIYTWIYRIAVNHILNHLKRARQMRWTRLLDENVVDLLKQNNPLFQPELQDPVNLEEAIEHKERNKVLWSAVEALPLKFRMPLVLFYYEQLSYQEIATAMNLSLSAVETRIHRAKKALFEEIRPLLEHL